ncbi:hypothetical protein B0T20DRAFT_474120 [Sordaria brevicollis]|uniref:Uncharacterized protein n=1 Tax=Sordaria brevicollis TaxID=83679 RepID=A0AAE0NRJ2_SORBR|nr:hypothetical protein B0T20DRAFT_474120 [Sordaria brevicollis]
MPARYKQIARASTGGKSPRRQPYMDREERDSFASGVTRFLEHSEDDDNKSSFDYGKAETLEPPPLEDSDAENHSEKAKDIDTMITQQPWEPIPWKSKEVKPSETKAWDTRSWETKPCDTKPKKIERKKTEPKQTEPKKIEPKEVKPDEKNTPIADQQHKVMPTLRVSLKTVQIAASLALAAFCLWALRCFSVLESRMTSAATALEKLDTGSSGNNGYVFALYVVPMVGMAACSVWMHRRLDDLESRITTKAA